jgi:NAD dependent epimerase/dehydratase family enzyme
LGSGRQYWPWIHRQDWIDLVRWTVQTPTVSGPVNATAPNPVTNKAFARSLGRALHRPAFMPAPAFALRLMLGEMADALLLAGQRAIPAKAARLGSTFRYSDLDATLRAIFGGA